LSARTVIQDEPSVESVIEQPVAAPRKITRENRKPFGSTDQKLAFPPRNGYHRHWFNDEPGRIYSAEQAGYDHVKGIDGKPVSRIVGTRQGGGAILAFLMEIPEEWYQEDMKRLQDEVDRKEAGIRRGNVEKADPTDKAKGAFYTGSDKGQIDIHTSFSRPRA
jgi:hypothetical protein